MSAGANSDNSMAAAVRKYGPIVSPLRLALPQAALDLLDHLCIVGDPFVVGGAVRDGVRVKEPKDIDIEVHDASIGDIKEHLRAVGYHVDAVGAAFGVLTVRTRHPESMSFDISVPRREVRVGVGHRGFEMEFDDMSIEDAAARRDFTFNSMMYDSKLEVVIDPFGGIESIENNVMTHTSQEFAQDPLRPLRAFQFAGRMGMKLSDRTALLCASMRHLFDDLPIERVQGEWDKFYHKGVYAARALDALEEMGWHDTVDEFERIDKGAVQRVAARGPVLVAAVMGRNMSEQAIRTLVGTITGNRLAKKAFTLATTQAPQTLTKASLSQWARELGVRGLTIADWQERETAFNVNTDHISQLAAEFGMLHGAPVDLVTGKMVTEMEVRNPGPWVGELLVRARKAQDEGEFDTEISARAWLQEVLSQLL